MSTIGGIGGSWAYQQPHQPPSFTQLDSNSDGGISLDEFEAGGPSGSPGSDATQSAARKQRAEALFNKIDTNGDGSISGDELNTFQTQMEEQRQSQAFATQLLANGQQPPSNNDVFSATDKNSDGSVSLDEFSQSDAAKNLSTDQLQQLFNTIDSNGDGSISSTESSDFLDELKSETASAGGRGGAGGPPPGGPPPGGPPPGGHVGGHHHPGGSDSSSSSDSSSGDSLLSTIEQILGTSSSTSTTDTGSTSSGTSASSDSSSSALDLLTAAVNAYSTGSSSGNFWSSFSNLLEDAA